MLRCDFEYKAANFQLAIQLDMQHQLIGIVGASGSGKTTLLKNIVGLLQPTQGHIHFNDSIMVDTQQHIVIPMHQRKIALIFQQALLFPHMSVAQNLRYAEKFIPFYDRKFQFTQVIELLELKPLIQRKSHQLSGGEAQRVSIARALLSSPNLLLLDEPLTGLDQRLKQQILPFLKMLKQETTLPMIYVTHHIEELEYLDAHVLTLEQGSLI
ncbi:ABC transporter, ATP-binding protein [Acinetobacter junii SH205]|jgi:molybdate transport system ATP-binding protein|uniref:ABC transporter, ATP-binding protein n=1 Tax=Acinetobacter junii SH205 TaxID=575587 RepID=D0SR65_ACIJU|nr:MULTISPECIES: ATP-binding cassette domain-containing protein [Acinetobacter]EEY91680.1 ABC transporter, ATP-binding protein [Acinetobacter junii SH205]MBC6677778.1 ATP-binding cassette domain-containing protein [Acinetobacter sp.]MDH1700120.1 ATP-binding cassette domain-containing protein [Acinetobacter johnsonii]HRB83058.1 ATP-binding cassette domain-containing protein [Acinetobacter johnsonii]HRM29116.1 ATP-binding cassette domain-containing protein [Acinetobacter johnsonii]